MVQHSGEATLAKRVPARCRNGVEDAATAQNAFQVVRRDGVPAILDRLLLNVLDFSENVPQSTVKSPVRHVRFQ
jgi:hypothetical protein